MPHPESGGSRSTDKSMVSNILKAALLHNKKIIVGTVPMKLSNVVSPGWYNCLREWLIRDDNEAKALEQFNTVKGQYDITLWCVRD